MGSPGFYGGSSSTVALCLQSPLASTWWAHGSGSQWLHTLAAIRGLPSAPDCAGRCADLWGVADTAARYADNVLETLRLQYVTTARAKGLSENRVIYKHALRNAINPLITLLGFEFATLFGGAAADGNCSELSRHGCAFARRPPGQGSIPGHVLAISHRQRSLLVLQEI